jgi:hypothetical protein
LSVFLESGLDFPDFVDFLTGFFLKSGGVDGFPFCLKNGLVLLVHFSDKLGGGFCGFCVHGISSYNLKKNIFFPQPQKMIKLRGKGGSQGQGKNPKGLSF